MVIHTTIRSITTHSITITDTTDIIPGTIMEVPFTEASILLSILHIIPLISVIIQVPIIATIQGIMQIMEEGKGKVFTLHGGTAVCLQQLLQDVTITCRVV